MEVGAHSGIWARLTDLFLIWQVIVCLKVTSVGEFIFTCA